MVKLSIAIHSNRPGNIKKFSTSIKEKLASLNTEVVAVIQPPVSLADCINVTKPIYHEAFDQSKPIPFVMLRHIAITSCVGEYILLVDDDHTFVDGSAKYLDECVSYMDSNPDVGILATKGVFGSVAWGDRIVKHPTSGVMATSRGVIIRNVSDAITNNEENKLVGAGDEYIIGYRIMAAGWSFAKRFMNPTLQAPTKQVGHNNISYNVNLMNNNVRQYIRTRYQDPNWSYIGHRPGAPIRFPKGLLVEQKRNRK